MKSKQFYKLQKGDYVKMRSKTPRKILAVTRHKIGGELRTYCIVLQKIRASQYPKDYTVYVSCDAWMFTKVRCIDARSNINILLGVVELLRVK